MSQLITRRGSFEAAHRLLSHPGKCRNLHGHRYEWILNLRVHSEDTTQVLPLDFGDLKLIFEGYLERYFDHATITNPADESLAEWLEVEDSREYRLSIGGSACLSSVENIAKELYLSAEVMFEDAEAIAVESITVHETAKNSTTVTAEAIEESERDHFAHLRRPRITSYLADLDL